MSKKCYIVPTQKKCNCDCVFCISKSRGYNKSIEYLVPDSKLKSNLIKLKFNGVKKFEITGGGEPLLNKDIQGIINMIKSVIPDSYIKLYTNGYIMKKILHIDELNISVVHDDVETNNHFMNSKSSVSLIDKLLYYKANMPNTKIRLSVPLINGAIDSKEKLDAFIELTDKYVDDYVVRTLYPNTANMNNLYVDFEYSNPNVTFERDNDVKDFDGLIMWSDSKIYNNWQLNKEVNLGLVYMLLKPDSQTYISEIEELIMIKNFIVLKKYLIHNFNNSALDLYNDKESDIEYYRKIKRHLENASYLFGNHGVILLLTKDLTDELLAEEILKIKFEIRQKYSFTGSKDGYLKINEDISHLNMVHVPDNDYLLHERDIELLSTNNCLRNEINDAEWSLVKKYKSYGGVK